MPAQALTASTRKSLNLACRPGINSCEISSAAENSMADAQRMTSRLW